MGRDPNWVAKVLLMVAKGRLVANEKSGKYQGITGEIPQIREVVKLSDKYLKVRESREIQ